MARAVFSVASRAVKVSFRSEGELPAQFSQADMILEKSMKTAMVREAQSKLNLKRFPSLVVQVFVFIT